MWNCDYCTSINEIEEYHCERCGAPRLEYKTEVSEKEIKHAMAIADANMKAIDKLTAYNEVVISGMKLNE